MKKVDISKLTKLEVLERIRAELHIRVENLLEADERFSNVVMEIEFFEEEPKNIKRVSIYDYLY
jgi:hypothetical protein